MILSRPYHVTRTLRQLPARRCLATAKSPTRRTEDWTSASRDSMLQNCFNFLGMTKPRQRVKSMLEHGVSRQWLVHAEFSPNIFLVKRTLIALLKGTLRARSIKDLEMSYNRRVTEPLWLDLFSKTRVSGQTVVSPVVKSTCKRRLKTAISGELVRRGVHPHGWDLAAYEDFWKARAQKDGVESPLPGDDTWQRLIPRRLQGTLSVAILDPRRVATADTKSLRKLAASIVAEMLSRQPRPPEPLLPPPSSRQKPWMQKLQKPGRRGAPADIAAESEADILDEF